VHAAADARGGSDGGGPSCQLEARHDKCSGDGEQRDPLLRDAAGVCAEAGLSLQDDTEGAVVCDLIDGDLAEQLLAPLYLPHVDPARMEAGGRSCGVGRAAPSPRRSGTSALG
jgi:hypothetical protein